MTRMTSSLLPAAAAAAIIVSGCGKPPKTAPAATVLEPDAAPATASTPAAATAPALPPVSVADGAVRFELTDDSEIGWTGYKVVGSHSGSFLLYEGTVDLPDGTLDAAEFDVLIETMSVITDDDTLTEVMKGESFFDVNNYPDATFVSTAVDREGETYLITGDLTLRDVTKSIRFPATLAAADGVFTLTAEFTVNRRDWGIVYDGIGDNLLKDDVLISLDVEAAQADGEG